MAIKYEAIWRQSTVMTFALLAVIGFAFDSSIKDGDHSAWQSSKITRSFVTYISIPGILIP